MNRQPSAAQRQRHEFRIAYPTHGALRLLSFALAITLTVLVLAYPKDIASSVSDVRHGVLALLMWGIAAGFVHGVGFVPRLPLWRIVFHPVTGWLTMAAGIAWLLAHQ